MLINPAIEIEAFNDTHIIIYVLKLVKGLPLLWLYNEIQIVLSANNINDRVLKFSATLIYCQRSVEPSFVIGKVRL